MSGVDDNDSISSSQTQVRRSTRIRAPSVDVQPLTPSKPKRVGRPRKTSTPTIENEPSVEVSDLPKTPSRRTTQRSPFVDENVVTRASVEMNDLPKTPSRRTTRRSSIVDENAVTRGSVEVSDLPKTPSRRTTRRSSIVDENALNKTPTKSMSLTQTETVKTPGRRNTRRSSLAEEPPRVVTPTKRNAKVTKEETNVDTESNTISRGRRILTPSNGVIVEETEQNEDKVLSPRRTLLKKAIVQIKKCDFPVAVETQSEFLGTSLEPVEEENQEIEKSEKSHTQTEDPEGNESDDVNPLNGISFVAFKPSMHSNEKKSPVRYPKTPAALLSKSSPRVLDQDEVEGNLPKRKSLSFEEVTHDSKNTTSTSLKEVEQEDVEMTDTTSPEEEQISQANNPKASEELVSEVDLTEDVTVVSDCHVDELAGGDSLIQLDGQKPENTTDTVRESTLTQCEKEKFNFAEESSLDGLLMQLDTDSIALTTAATVDDNKKLEDTVVLSEDDKVNGTPNNDVIIEDVTPIKSPKLETSVDTTETEAGQEQDECNKEPGKSTEREESLLSFLEEGSDTENVSPSSSSIKLSRLLQRMHNGGENITSKSESFYEDEYTLSVTQEMEENVKGTAGVESNENKTDEPEPVMSQEKLLEPNSLITKEAPKLNGDISNVEQNQCFEAGDEKDSFIPSKEGESSNEVSHDSMNTSSTTTKTRGKNDKTEDVAMNDVSMEEANVSQSNKTDPSRQNSDEDIEQLTSKATPSTIDTEAETLGSISVEEDTAIRTTSGVEASTTVIPDTSQAEQLCFESENIVEVPLNSDKMDMLTEQKESNGYISLEDVQCITAEQMGNSSAVDESMETPANNVSSCMEVENVLEAEVNDDSSVNKTLEHVSESGRNETVDKPEQLENSLAVDVSMDTLTNNISSCMEVNSSSTTAQLDSNHEENVEKADSSMNKTLEQVDKPEQLECAVGVSMDTLTNNVSSCTEVENVVEVEVNDDPSMNKTLEQVPESGRNETIDKTELLGNSSIMNVSKDSLTNNVSSCTEVNSSSKPLAEHVEQTGVEVEVNDDPSMNKTLEQVPESGRNDTIDKPELLGNSSIMNVSMDTLTNNVSSCTEVNSFSKPLAEHVEQTGVEVEVNDDPSMNKTLEHDSTLEALNASLDVDVEEIIEDSCAVTTEFCEETVNNELTHEIETQLENSETEVENLETELENKSIQNQTDLEQQDLEQSVEVTEQSKSDENSVQESSASKDEPECSYPIPEEIIFVSQETSICTENTEQTKEEGSISVSHKEVKESNDFELHVSSDSCTMDSSKQPEVSCPAVGDKHESNYEVLEEAASPNEDKMLEIQGEVNELTSHNENDHEVVSSEKQNQIPEHAEDLGSEDTECEEDEEGEEENVNDSFIVSDDAEESISISSEQEYVSFEDTNVAQPLKSMDETCENVKLPENSTNDQPHNKPDEPNHLDNKDLTETKGAPELVQSSSRKTNSNTEADNRTPKKMQLEIEVEVSNEILHRSIEIDALDTEIGIYFENANGTNKSKISIGKSPQKSKTNEINEESKEVTAIRNCNKKLEEESATKVSLLQNGLGGSSSQSLNKSETKKHKTERTKKHAVETLDKSERKNDEENINVASMKISKQIKKESSKSNKRNASDLESSTSSIEKRIKLLPTVPTSDIKVSLKSKECKDIPKSKRVIATEKSVEQPKVTASKDQKQKLKSQNEEKSYKHLGNIVCSVKDVSEIIGNNSELTLPNQTIKINQLETKPSRKTVSTSLPENDLKNKDKKQKVLKSNTTVKKPTEGLSRSKMTESVTANVNSDNVQTTQKKIKNIALKEDVDHSYEHNKENNGKVATPSGIFKEEMLTPKKVKHAPGFIVTDKTPKAVGFTVKSLVKERENNRSDWKIENVQRSLHDIVEPPNTPSGFKSTSIATPSKTANKPNQRYFIETELSFSAKRGRKRKNTTDASCYAPIKIKTIR